MLVSIRTNVGKDDSPILDILEYDIREDAAPPGKVLVLGEGLLEIFVVTNDDIGPGQPHGKHVTILFGKFR